MDKPDFRLASDEAAALLLKYGYQKPPVDPEEIAESEGLSVLYAQFEEPADENVSGFFQLKGKKIFVNNDIHENRITFTIAHELGHYIMHQDYIASQNYRPMPRNNEYEGEKPKEEIEADMFAANLLVPFSMLRKYKDFGNVRELARMFFVSEEVIRNRLNLLDRHPYLR